MTLKEIDELIDRLVRESFDLLPAEQIGMVALEARTLKDLLHDENPIAAGSSGQWTPSRRRPRAPRQSSRSHIS